MLRSHQRVRQSVMRAIGLCIMPILLFGLFYSDGTMALAAEGEQDVHTPLCRFGINVDPRVAAITAYDTDPLRIGWYQSYQAQVSPASPNGAEYVQVIRLSQDVNDNYSYSPSQTQIEKVIDSNPGATWFIGNEPDRRTFQDDIKPDVYAEVYHELYQLIKGRDPAARIFPGSIVQATELRLQYLDMVLSSYRQKYDAPMPLDGWSIHGFILNEVRGDWGADIPPGIDAERGLILGEVDENGNIIYDVQLTTDLDLYKSHVVNFRSWMKHNGYRNFPLYMSEYGVLMPKGDFEPDFDEGRVNAFMDATFDFLLTATDPNTGYPADGNHLVQKLSWYSANDKEHFNGYLFDEDNNNQPSLMGENYAQYTSGVDAELDLSPVSVYVQPYAPLVQDGPAELTIYAQIANSGNLLQETDAVVRFYNGDPDQGGTQIGAAQPVSVGGCGETKTVHVELTNATPGAYQFYAVVEATGGTDIQPDNNKAGSTFFFASNRLFTPQISLSR